MKNIHYIFIAIIVVLLGVYFFGFKKDDSLNLKYQEPDSKFFSASEISATDTVVEIFDTGFVPATLNIKKGEKIIFVNKTSSYTWPASDPHPTHTNYSSSSPNFDPELPLKPNEAWDFTFEKIGEWKFHDHLDPSKRGVITVGE